MIVTVVQPTLRDNDQFLQSSSIIEPYLRRLSGIIIKVPRRIRDTPRHRVSSQLSLHIVHVAAI